MRTSQIKAMPGHLIRRAQQASTAYFAELLDDQDITSVQYMALAAIEELPGLDATRLAEIIGYDRATTGDVIERLERKSLIARSRSQADGRVKTLAITAAGASLLKSCHAGVRAVQARLLAPLSKEESELFLRLLSRVAREPEA